MKPLFRACPVCRNFDQSRLTIIGTLKPTFHFTLNQVPEFKLIECSICKTIYQTPLPSDAILQELYVDNAQFSSETYTGEHAKSAMTYYKSCARNMMAMLGKTKNLKILEIGSGLSWMCRAVKELDKTNTTVAQDITPECKNICTWVDNYVIGSCEENYGLIKRLGPYDIISLTHVIEHLNYPVDFLILMKPLLSQNGIFFITAPYQPVHWKNFNNNINVWQAWSYNHVPAHLQYFTEESIDAISNIAGLRVLAYDNTHDGGQAFELMLSKF